MAAGVVTRDDVERALWMQSGWQIEQENVDALLAVIDGYASNGAPVTVETVCEHGESGGVWVTGCGEDGHIPCCMPPVPEPEPVMEDSAPAELAPVVAEPSPAGLSPFPVPFGPGQAFKAADGGVWLYLGSPSQVPIRQCRSCELVKEMAEFRKDAHSRGGRRTECSQCENAGRRRRDQAAKVAA